MNCSWRSPIAVDDVLLQQDPWLCLHVGMFFSGCWLINCAHLLTLLLLLLHLLLHIKGENDRIPLMDLGVGAGLDVNAQVGRPGQARWEKCWGRGAAKMAGLGGGTCTRPRQSNHVCFTSLILHVKTRPSVSAVWATVVPSSSAAAVQLDHTTCSLLLQRLHFIARLKVGQLFTVKLLPQPVIKLGHVWRLPGTGVALRFR
jgi:hypothetical protein